MFSDGDQDGPVPSPESFLVSEPYFSFRSQPYWRRPIDKFLFLGKLHRVTCGITENGSMSLGTIKPMCLTASQVLIQNPIWYPLFASIATLASK